MRHFQALIAFIIILLFCPFSSSANEDYPIDQLLSDIHSRKLDKAIPWLEKEILEMESNNTSFDDLSYVGCVNLLATCYVQTNNLLKAEDLVKKSINYLINNQPKSSNLYQLFFFYGCLQSSVSNHVVAEDYVAKSVELLEKNGSGNVNEYAIILASLATCYINNGKQNEAILSIKKSLKYIDNSEISKSTKVQILQKAGYIYSSLGQHEESLSITKKAFDICKDDDELTSEFINTASNLAVIYTNSGKYKESSEIFKILEKYPLNDKEKFFIYNNICLDYFSLGDTKNCSIYAVKSSENLKERILKITTSLPTTISQYQWEEYAIQLNVLNGYLENMKDDDYYVSMCFDNQIFRKTLQYNLSKALKEQKKDNVTFELYKSIKKLKANLYVKEDYSQNFEDLQYKERQLGLTLSDSLLKSVRFKKWTDVQRLLENDDIAIEIITFSSYTKENSVLPLKYGALIISKDTKKPVFVEIGSFNHFHEVIQNSLNNGIYGINNLYLKENQYLYDFFWKKLLPFTNNKKNIYISPTSELQGVNLSFSCCPDGQYISEKYNIQIVTSTANIKNNFNAKKIKDATIYGGVDFNNNDNSIAKKDDTFRDAVYELIMDTTRSNFNYLKGTEEEVNNIDRILRSNRINCHMRKSVDASEESFRNLDANSSDIIHIATHAFYLVGSELHNSYFNKFSTLYNTDRTMLLSGLLLANANNAIKADQSEINLNDGVITSEEVALLDLSKTELVVLSACNTGKGVSSDGYGGLIKAFKLAGVKHLLVSLWPVSDLSTSYLMKIFYENIFKGMEIHKALEKAQLETRKVYSDPYYWAGFLLID